MYLIDMRSALYVMPYNIKKVFSYFLDVTRCSLREIDGNLSLWMYF